MEHQHQTLIRWGSHDAESDAARLRGERQLCGCRLNAGRCRCHQPQLRSLSFPTAHLTRPGLPLAQPPGGASGPAESGTRPSPRGTSAQPFPATSQVATHHPGKLSSYGSCLVSRALGSSKPENGHGSA
ncbi:uncharacterized protein WM277_024010 isoform 2-T2 [Molossus nigricans]